ncbi:hypothetical protein NFI96_016591 [Prochilodus magdalenae]|nr:hypothetical protein NFI96_016591 [Prochilodus magdalenae]
MPDHILQQSQHHGYVGEGSGVPTFLESGLYHATGIFNCGCAEEDHNQTEETYDNVVGPGKYVFPFSLRIPHGDIPPSFKAFHGSVKYALEARLDRSWKTKRTAYREINFVPRIDVDDHLMVCTQVKTYVFYRPQSAATDKKMRLFTSGSASFEATIDKMGYMQGEVIRVSTYVDNSSSRDLKLKCSLEQKQAFYAQGRSKNSSYNIFKVVEDPIPSGSSQTVNTDLRIPSNLQVTIRSSSIIKLEYILKVPVFFLLCSYMPSSLKCLC